MNFYPTDEDNLQRISMELTADAATMALIRTRIKDTAREHKPSEHKLSEHKPSMVDAAVTLILGDVSTTVKTVLHVFSPKGTTTKDGASVFIPGIGWTNTDTTTNAAELIDTTDSKTIDLDDTATDETAAYIPTAAMAAYVRARDGACIHPGCTRPAIACQINHRIPHPEGGPTRPDNLYTLCRYHHREKTDRRSYYIPAHITGEVAWLFSDGTWAIAENKGTLAEHKAHRARTARFHAVCYTLCDTYDTTGDATTCIESTRKLENEYNMTFDYTPEPEPTNHDPAPPWDPNGDIYGQFHELHPTI